MREFYEPGGFWRDCQRCGFKCRNYNTKKEWTGLIVCDECWEPRHPQDSVRGRKDNQSVPSPRPEPPDTFIGDFLTDSEGAHVSDSSGASLRSGLAIDYGH